MFLSQISCQTFLCLSQARPHETGLWKHGTCPRNWDYLMLFPNFTIIYLVVPVYYCPGHPSNTTSSGDLKLYVGFQKVASEPIEHRDFVDPQGRSWRSLYQTQNNLDYLQIKFFKVNPQRNMNILVPTFSAL